MATGTVTSLNPIQGYLGYITADETGELYYIVEASGLTVGESVTFDIQEDAKSPSGYDAVHIQAAPKQQIITIPPGGSKGNITAGETDNIKIVQADINNPGTLTGNITINGGMVYVDNGAIINGSLTIQSGGVCTIKKQGTVSDGGHTVSSGGNLKVVNGGSISGDISGDSAGVIVIGNSNGGGTVKGNINIKKIHRLSITNTSSINCG